MRIPTKTSDTGSKENHAAPLPAPLLPVQVQRPLHVPYLVCRKAEVSQASLSHKRAGSSS